MGFFNILPRDKTYMNNNISPVPLKVIRDDGVDITPNIDIKMTDLQGGYKHFFNNTHIGESFKISIFIDENDTVDGKPLNSNRSNSVTSFLDYLARNMIPVIIETSAIGIDSDMYIISNNPRRKQSYEGSTVWELTFHTYTQLNLVKFANDNSAVLNAIRKAKAEKKVKYPELKKCSYKKLKYSKKKKVTNCVKTLQKVLYKMKVLDKKYIDGWYGKTTKTAVKKYQKRYNKNHTVYTISQNTSTLMKVNAGTLVNGGEFATMTSNAKLNTTINKKTKKITKKLKETGKVDKATWIALYQGEK